MKLLITILVLLILDCDVQAQKGTNRQNTDSPKLLIGRWKYIRNNDHLFPNFLEFSSNGMATITSPLDSVGHFEIGTYRYFTRNDTIFLNNKQGETKMLFAAVSKDSLHLEWNIYGKVTSSYYRVK